MKLIVAFIGLLAALSLACEVTAAIICFQRGAWPLAVLALLIAVWTVHICRFEWRAWQERERQRDAELRRLLCVAAPRESAAGKSVEAEFNRVHDELLARARLKLRASRSRIDEWRTRP